MLKQPWVSASTSEGGRWGIGCDACSQANAAGQLHLSRMELATFSCQTPRKDLLRKHQATAQHQKSVLQALGVDLGPRGTPLLGAPSLEAFNEVLAQVLRGESMRAMDQGGTGDRMKNMRFCLLEALMEEDRAFIRRAKTMVLLRDERRGRLVVRYAACTGDLETRRGTVAVMRDYDSPTADNIVKATRQAFKQFCTHRAGRPRSMPALPAPEVDRDLLQHMRQITEMLVSDSAASELLAAEISRGRRGKAESDGAFTPNVKVVGRDFAHCARWVLKKPWLADKNLAALFERTVWHETSRDPDHRQKRRLPAMVPRVL